MPIIIMPLILFQFTPLREGRQPTMSIQDIICMFQFTPLREGRRLNNVPDKQLPIVSIHAPA